MKKLLTLFAFICISVAEISAQQVDTCTYTTDIGTAMFNNWPNQFPYDGIITDWVAFTDSSRDVGTISIMLHNVGAPYPVRQVVFNGDSAGTDGIHIWGTVDWTAFQFSGPFELYVEVEIARYDNGAVEVLLYSEPILIDPADYLTVTSIDEPIELEKGAIYPNPANHEVTVKAPTGAELRIINPLGKDVIVKPNESVDIARLSSGIYFVTGTLNGKAIKPEKLMVY